MKVKVIQTKIKIYIFVANITTPCLKEILINTGMQVFDTINKAAVVSPEHIIRSLACYQDVQF